MSTNDRDEHRHILGPDGKPAHGDTSLAALPQPKVLRSRNLRAIRSAALAIAAIVSAVTAVYYTRYAGKQLETTLRNSEDTKKLFEVNRQQAAAAGRAADAMAKQADAALRAADAAEISALAAQRSAATTEKAFALALVPYMAVESVEVDRRQPNPEVHVVLRNRGTQPAFNVKHEWKSEVLIENEVANDTGLPQVRKHGSEVPIPT